MNKAGFLIGFVIVLVLAVVGYAAVSYSPARGSADYCYPTPTRIAHNTPTILPSITPTDTLVPTSTDTLIPTSTNTPTATTVYDTPVPTDTPIEHPTYTRVPKGFSTPTIVPPCQTCCDTKDLNRIANAMETIAAFLSHATPQK